MTGPKTWTDLSPREKEQVSLMLFSLKEFSYGYDRADAVAKEVPAGAAILRFYMTSLYQYYANYFLVGGARRLRDVLKALGSGDLLQPIDDQLATQLGGTTFGEIIRTWRDKFLTHQSFTFDPMESRILPRFDYGEPGNARRLMDLVHQLFSETQRLHVALALQYPEASGA